MKLLGFDFQIHYKKVKENLAAYALSWKFEIQVCAISSSISNWVDPITYEILANPHLQELVEKIKEGEALGPWLFNEWLIFFKDRIFLLPTSELIIPIIKGSTNLSTESN